MPQIAVPAYDGGSLVNLIAELEYRLIGSSSSPTLNPELSTEIGTAETFVFVLFDGLGSHQLDHPNTPDLVAAHRRDIDAPFPYTTTVSLASVATGLPPAQHGLIAYQLWMNEIDKVVNTIHMTTLWGDTIDLDYDAFLPEPNLGERLKAAGREAIVVQPGYFDRTPLTRALYRGARFEPYWSTEEAVNVTLDAALDPGRLIFLYIPNVDFAAHVAGQASQEYAEAMQIANTVWRELSKRLPDDVGLVGTADHGHIDIAEDRKIRLSNADHKNRTFYGAERAVFVNGEGASLADGLPAIWVPREDLPELWGPGPAHTRLDARIPDGILFADDGYAIFHKHSNDRLVGYHGGLMPEERLIPLLVR